MPAKAGLRERLVDSVVRPSTVVAVALTIVGFLFVLLEMESPSRLYWTGDAVSGTNSGGIVYYTVHEDEYTLDALGPAPEHDTPVTVYVDPADPSRALLQSPTRWIDAFGIVVWFVAAAACLTVPAVKRASGRRRRASSSSAEETFGEGLDSDLVQRYLERSRRPPRRP